MDKEDKITFGITASLLLAVVLGCGYCYTRMTTYYCPDHGEAMTTKQVDWDEVPPMSGKLYKYYDCPKGHSVRVRY